MDSAAQVVAVAVAVTVVVVVVVKRWCPLRHSSLRTPNTLPLQLWHNAGGTKLWSWMTKKSNKKTFYRMIWYSITRREHIKSQYLQIVTILAMLAGDSFPLGARNILISWDTCCLYVQTWNSVLVVENRVKRKNTKITKYIYEDNSRCQWSFQSRICLVDFFKYVYKNQQFPNWWWETALRFCGCRIMTHSYLIRLCHTVLHTLL